MLNWYAWPCWRRTPLVKPRIIYIPGKNLEPEPGVHGELLRRALQAGLARTQPAIVYRFASVQFEVAGWNHLYYGAHKDHLPEQYWLEQLLEQQHDIAADRAAVHTPRVHLEKLLHKVAADFPFLMRWLADPVVRQTVEETERYFDHRRDIGRSVREVLKSKLKPALSAGAPVLLIGHSLGSVIAWDTLWELTHEEGHEGRLDLLTLGSPLGLRFVQRRLLGHDCTGTARYPHLIGSWHNVAAVGDLVSLDPSLADDFRAMWELGLVEEITDHYRGVYNHYQGANGLNPHNAYGYLVNPVVATRIAGWIWRCAQTTRE